MLTCVIELTHDFGDVDGNCSLAEGGCALTPLDTIRPPNMVRLNLISAHHCVSGHTTFTGVQFEPLEE